jgi:hypothetical protein
VAAVVWNAACLFEQQDSWRMAIKQVRDHLAFLSSIWCAMMHRETTWPINGHYQCLKCKRVFEVPWDSI